MANTNAKNLLDPADVIVLLFSCVFFFLLTVYSIIVCTCSKKPKISEKSSRGTKSAELSGEGHSNSTYDKETKKTANVQESPRKKKSQDAATENPEPNVPESSVPSSPPQLWVPATANPPPEPSTTPIQYPVPLEQRGGSMSLQTVKIFNLESLGRPSFASSNNKTTAGIQEPPKVSPSNIPLTVETKSPAKKSPAVEPPKVDIPTQQPPKTPATTESRSKQPVQSVSLISTDFTKTTSKDTSVSKSKKRKSRTPSGLAVKTDEKKPTDKKETDEKTPTDKPETDEKKPTDKKEKKVKEKKKRKKGGSRSKPKKSVAKQSVAKKAAEDDDDDDDD